MRTPETEIAIARKRAVCRPAQRPVRGRINATTPALILACAAGLWLGAHGGMARAQEPSAKPLADDAAAKCPVMGELAPANRNTVAAALSNRDWWPNQLNLK